MADKESFSGPHVAAAFLCEKVLTERDGVPSFIRVIERFTVLRPKLPPGAVLPPGMQLPPPMIQFTIVVVLKAGDLPVGKYNLKITLVKPNGEETQSQEAQAFFSASGESGIAVISPVVIPAPDEGLHWFDVYFEEKQITRIPVRVLYQEVPILQMPSAPPH